MPEPRDHPSPQWQGDDTDRWRSRKTAGDLRNLGQQAVRDFKALVLVHRWELWNRAKNV